MYKYMLVFQIVCHQAFLIRKPALKKIPFGCEGDHALVLIESRRFVYHLLPGVYACSRGIPRLEHGLKLFHHHRRGVDDFLEDMRLVVQRHDVDPFFADDEKRDRTDGDAAAAAAAERHRGLQVCVAMLADFACILAVKIAAPRSESKADAADRKDDAAVWNL